MQPSLIVFLVLALVVVILVARTATVVPQQSAFVVEKLGRYSRTLPAGSSRCAAATPASSAAAASRIAVCASWPQPWQTPSTVER